MDLFLSTELLELRSAVRDFFSEIGSRSTVLNTVPSSCDASSLAGMLSAEAVETVWNGLARDGFLAAPVPKNLGGGGLGVLAAQVLVEACGRELSPLPVFETVAFGILPLMLLGSAEAQRGLFRQIVTGSLRLSGSIELAYPASRRTMLGNPNEQNTGTDAAIMGDVHACIADLDKAADFTHLLSGVSMLVPALDRVQALLIGARSDSVDGENQSDHPGLFLVNMKGQPRKAVSVEQLPTLDRVRSYFVVNFKEARAVRISRSELSDEDWMMLRAGISLFHAAELVGLAAVLVERTTAYVKNRIQFGRAIGSFQAIQHRAADMHLKAEQAAALVRFAFWCLENDRRQFLLTANAAKGYASEVVPWIAEQAIQCHGGRGMSSDSGLHLYLRRARVLALSCKTERECYTELANMLLAQP